MPNTAPEDEKKKPRGIRFRGSDYKELQDACKVAGYVHLDDFIMELIRGRKNKVRMSRLKRDILTSIEENRVLTLQGVQDLLDKYTGE